MSLLNILRPIFLGVFLGSSTTDVSMGASWPLVEPLFLVANDRSFETVNLAGADTSTPPLLGPSLRYGVDTTVSPCVDFYQYVNGDWRSRTRMDTSGAERPRRINAFDDTYSRAQQRLQGILDSAYSVASTTTDPTLKVLGIFFESCLVADTLDRQPLRRSRDTIPRRDSTRAEQCLQRTIMSLGGALGQAFARDLLVSNARTKMQQLVDALRGAVIARLKANQWMTTDEKALALHRLERLHLRIGMPVEMDDYRGLVLSPVNYLQNRATINNFENIQRTRSIGGDHRAQWTNSLLTANAAYTPSQHALEVPAMMFMPPFFDANGEDALNFAGVGYVIAHEIFHSIAGQLRTVEHAEMKTQINQFKMMQSMLGTVDGWGTDGERTFGEDIADLGGVLVAYDAWQATIKTRKKRPAPVVDGYTPDQRFFIGLGRVWRSKWRGSIFNRDSHAAPFARVNAMVMQSPMFAKAFGCTDSDPMVLPVEKRASIW